MTAVFDHPSFDGHELVSFIDDRRSGLRGIIALHSTQLGPALGGTRLWHYASPDDALTDALRLSRGMTSKAALAGLPLGGGKAVLLDEAGLDRAAILTAYARAVDGLDGRFITGEDVGITEADVDLVAQTTGFVAGRSSSTGGLGDPSPRTAAGVLAAMRAAMAFLDGDRSMAGRRVAISGLGKVGRALCRLLAAEGADLVVADVSSAAVHHAGDVAGPRLRVADPGSIHRTACDIFAPCALGGVLNAVTVPQLRCRAVVGSANNQLADGRCAELLASRCVVYVPDYLANAGGLIQVAGEWFGYEPEEIESRTLAIEQTADALLRHAGRNRVTPAAAADALVAARLAQGPPAATLAASAG